MRSRNGVQNMKVIDQFKKMKVLFRQPDQVNLPLLDKLVQCDSKWWEAFQDNQLPKVCGRRVKVVKIWPSWNFGWRVCLMVKNQVFPTAIPWLEKALWREFSHCEELTLDFRRWYRHRFVEKQQRPQLGKFWLLLGNMVFYQISAIQLVSGKLSDEDTLVMGTFFFIAGVPNSILKLSYYQPHAPYHYHGSFENMPASGISEQVIAGSLNFNQDLAKEWLAKHKLPLYHFNTGKKVDVIWNGQLLPGKWSWLAKSDSKLACHEMPLRLLWLRGVDNKPSKKLFQPLGIKHHLNLLIEIKVKFYNDISQQYLYAQKMIWQQDHLDCNWFGPCNGWQVVSQVLLDSRRWSSWVCLQNVSKRAANQGLVMSYVDAWYCWCDPQTWTRLKGDVVLLSSAIPAGICMLTLETWRPLYRLVAG